MMNLWRSMALTTLRAKALIILVMLNHGLKAVVIENDLST
jgi:hypothetical protein